MDQRVSRGASDDRWDIRTGKKGEKQRSNEYRFTPLSNARESGGGGERHSINVMWVCISFYTESILDSQ